MSPHPLVRLSAAVARRTRVLLLLSLLCVPAFVVGANPAAAATSGSALKATSTLRPGAHGTAVKTLQKLLAKAGFKTATDGQYGSGTAGVVKRFQTAANLKATGIADPATIAALRAATSGKVAMNQGGGYDSTVGAGAHQHLGDRIPLTQGMNGHDVMVLQDFLTRAGFKVTIDGDFGASTFKQVKAFEADQQQTVDGIVDANDIALLRSLSTGDTTTAADPTTVTPAATTPGTTATVGADGTAVAPASAPVAVQQIIAAGNAIAEKPYIYGGGHGKWQDTGYDCSGSVSYALHGAGLLDTQLVSGDFETWGAKGAGQWVTIYANAGHVYMTVAGLRFDTSGRAQDGTRWHTDLRSNSGYVVTHPVGL